MTERRKDARRPADGVVELDVDGSARTRISGTLLDVSQAGFRVRHQCLSLGSGERVGYAYAGGTGRAMVMWTRVFGGEAESGLYRLK